MSATYSGGILSDQIKFYHCTEIAFVTSAPSGTGTAISYDTVAHKLYKGSSEVQLTDAAFIQTKQLQSVPSLGGTTNKIDVTCLDDTVKKTIPGLIDYGDSVDFSFLYDPISYGELDALGKDNTKGFIVAFKAPNDTYSSGDMFIFNGKCSVAIDDVAVDSALTFTASVSPQSEIKRNPAVAA